MRYIHFLLLVCLLGFTEVRAESKTECHVNILVGQQLDYQSAWINPSGFIFESGAEFVTASAVGKKLVLKGIKAGDARIRLATCQGQTTVLNVKDRRLC